MGDTWWAVAVLGGHGEGHLQARLINSHAAILLPRFGVSSALPHLATRADERREREYACLVWEMSQLPLH